MKRAELYCEGYDDRAFLVGWFEDRGWANQRSVHDHQGRVINPVTQKVVAGGRFAFQFEDAMYLEVIPSQGKENAVRDACKALERSLTDAAPPANVIVARDLDDQDLGDCRHKLRQRLEASREPTSSIEISTLIWHAAGDFGPGVPTEQTLERLVCGAVSRAYSGRGRTVQEWLTATGNSQPSPKSYSWSHMAGWYAKHGCDDFFRHVWREEPVRGQLQALLDECGMKELVALESGSSS